MIYCVKKVTELPLISSRTRARPELTVAAATIRINTVHEVFMIEVPSGSLLVSSSGRVLTRNLLPSGA